MAEWLKAPVSKTGIPQGIVSSNLTASATTMRILSIETSCDETAVALLNVTGPASKPAVTILGNSLFSQASLHEQYGGVFPTLAKREHEKNLPILLEQTLNEANEATEAPELDLIAVTAGPGLEPALWAGITFAEELGKKWNKPILGVDHMKGHVWSVLSSQEVELPALALLVSGGHTELVEVSDWHSFKVLGRTLDDAVGEAFDKVARMLGLPYPGGPKISALAEVARQKGKSPIFKLPRPMIHTNDLNFSYSGLKTAVLYKLKELGNIDESIKEDFALEFEAAAIEVLVAKTRKAIEESNIEYKTLIIGGGVAASKYLQEEFRNLAKEFSSISLKLPEKSLTTDNAVMIGLAAYVEATAKPESLNRPGKIIARGNLSISSQE